MHLPQPNGTEVRTLTINSLLVTWKTNPLALDRYNSACQQQANDAGEQQEQSTTDP